MDSESAFIQAAVSAIQEKRVIDFENILVQNILNTQNHIALQELLAKPELSIFFQNADKNIKEKLKNFFENALQKAIEKSENELEKKNCNKFIETLLNAKITKEYIDLHSKNSRPYFMYALLSLNPKIADLLYSLDANLYACSPRNKKSVFTEIGTTIIQMEKMKDKANIEDKEKAERGIPLLKEILSALIHKYKMDPFMMDDNNKSIVSIAKKSKNKILLEVLKPEIEKNTKVRAEALLKSLENKNPKDTIKIAFLEAIQKNDMEILNFLTNNILTKNYVQPISNDDDVKAVLEEAYFKSLVENNEEMLHLLMKHTNIKGYIEINKYYKNSTAFGSAMDKGYFNIAKILVMNGADPYLCRLDTSPEYHHRSVLTIAANSLDVKNMFFLLKTKENGGLNLDPYHPDLNGDTVFSIINNLKMSVQTEEQNKLIRVMEVILKPHFDPKKEESWLIKAVNEGQTEKVEALYVSAIESQDLNRVKMFLETKNEKLKNLIYNLNNKKSDKPTPFMLAVTSGFYKVAELMLEKSEKVDMDACQALVVELGYNKDLQGVQFLMNKLNLDPYKPNDQGETLVSVVKAHLHHNKNDVDAKKILDFLKPAMSDDNERRWLIEISKRKDSNIILNRLYASAIKNKDFDLVEKMVSIPEIKIHIDSRIIKNPTEVDPIPISYLPKKR